MTIEVPQVPNAAQAPEGAAREAEALNWLLEAAFDSAEGYRQGAELARNPDLRGLCLRGAEQRDELTRGLAEQVRARGQDPSDEGTMIGDAHKAFTFVRNAVGGGSDKGLVEELLRREQAVAGKFRTASDDPRLPAAAREAARVALPELEAAAGELARLEQQFG
jgi:uncharacterized protein (TIGR02284 family)